MAWKQSGQPTIQQQRSKWVARVEGIDTETGKRRPRQIGTRLVGHRPWDRDQ